MGFVGRKPTNAPLTSDDIPNGIIGAEDLSSGLSKLTWDTTAKTSGFTAVSNTGYVCNTTSSAFTVTLPASPTAGDTIQLLDYAGTFDTNALTISPNGNKIEGSTSSHTLNGEREGVRLVYIDSTQGWLATSGINEGTDALSPIPYSIDFLVIAGGGGGGWDQNNDVGAGGGGAGGYRNSYSTETSGGGGSSEASLTFNVGTVYTITVGAGGAGNTGGGTYLGDNGVNSSISGTGISTITSTGGGGGAGASGGAAGAAGGSGGGSRNSGAAGAGTANQGFAGQVGTNNPNGGGGGAAEAGGTDGNGQGGDGLASSITGSSVTRAGGGGGGGKFASGGIGGNGGGGDGGTNAVGTSGTANTGGGGGGGGGDNTGGNGGKGVVILRIPTANYSGTTTGSPTVTTDGSDKVIVFNDSGSITG